MAKIRTEAALQARLDSHIGWRLTEISELRAAIVGATGNRRPVILRATIPLCYAHWEGFVKNASIDYAVYVSTVVARYADLKPSFYGTRAIAIVAQLSELRKRVAASSRLMGELLDIASEKPKIDLRSNLENVGNLDHDLFVDVLQFLNIDPLPYQGKKVFINEVLLKARNSIAHGEREVIDREAGLSVCDEVRNLIRQFKTDLENSATLKTYLA